MREHNHVPHKICVMREHKHVPHKICHERSCKVLNLISTISVATTQFAFLIRESFE